MVTDIANDPEKAATGLVITAADYLPDSVQFEKAEVVQTLKYANGKPLVTREELDRLPTMMWRLHEWYLKACKDGTDNIFVGIEDEHFFNGEHVLFIEFEEIFQLYNQKELDKTIASSYCL